MGRSLKYEQNSQQEQQLGLTAGEAQEQIC
jgi:hypothetical protein